MSYAPFIVPSDGDFEREFGVCPVVEEGSEARVLDLEPVTGQTLRFSYDPLGRSVRLVWRRGDAVDMDMFREGAAELRIVTERGAASIVTRFDWGDLMGELALAVFPDVSIVDRTLFR
jgi:YD repeat-containing protein